MKHNYRKNPILFSLAILLLTSLLTSCMGGAGQVKSNWPEMLVDTESETVYLSAGPHLYAINLTNGSERWHFPSEADNKVSFYAAPALTSDNQVILAGYDHIVYSLDPANGTEKWRFAEATDTFVASPLVLESGIYAPSSDNFLYALGLSGNFIWKFETDEDQWSTPVTDGKTIFLAAMDHRLHALDIETGNQLWESEALGGAIAGSPALVPDGVLYIGTIAEEMLAIDSGDGSVLWRVPAGGWIWSGPLLAGGRLYYGDMDGSVYAVDSTNGSIIWRIQPDTGEDRAITGTPLVIGDTLYFGAASGTLYAVNLSDGSPRWNKVLDGKLHSGPVGAGERILVAPTAGDQLLVALDQNGNQVWAFSQQK